MKATIFYAAIVCALNTLGVASAIVAPTSGAHPAPFGMFALLFVFSANFAATILLILAGGRAWEQE